MNLMLFLKNKKIKIKIYKIMEISLKFILLGYSMVGKTQILNHYIEKKYIKITYPTIGIDFKKTTIKLNEKTLKLIIWDTAGPERYFQITQNYLKYTDVFILIYEIIDRYSFEYLIHYINAIYEVKNKEDIILGIVGNKNDLYEERKVKLKKIS